MMEDRPSHWHALRRTSPKGPGQQFIGVCTLCGKEGLTFADMAAECENVRGLTSNEALVEIVTDRTS